MAKAQRKQGNELKGVILAGGSGTRLKPMTSVVCKQLLPVYDKPMIYYPLSTLIHAGVTEVLLVSSPDQLDNFKNLLKDGKQYGITIEYKEQKIPAGLPQGITLAEDFLNGESFWFILGDNLFHGPDFGASLRQFALESKRGAGVFAYRVSDVSQYGVVIYSKDGKKVIHVEEKPTLTEPGWAIPGLYFFDNKSVDLAKNLSLSQRGEYEIIDLIKCYLQMDELRVKRISRGNAWFDLGTTENLLTGSNFVHLIQTRQGLLVGSPEEAALNAGILSLENFNLNVFNSSGSSYFQTLRFLAQNNPQ
jgi:glucose-1-phosphate thymidylyltransferase